MGVCTLTNVQRLVKLFIYSITTLSVKASRFKRNVRGGSLLNQGKYQNQNLFLHTLTGTLSKLILTVNVAILAFMQTYYD